MRHQLGTSLTALGGLLLAACSDEAAMIVPEAATDESASDFLRVATFNVALYRSESGALTRDLANGGGDQLEAVEAIIRDVDPDILIVTEFDYDEAGEAVGLFAERLGYPYALALPSNTGVPSGVDLDGDGRADHPQGSRSYGGDAFGYGVHPGQYAFAILSKHPIDEEGVRTFRRFLWRDLPGNLLPTDYYTEEAQAIFRLSSKNHADVPVRVADETVHIIAAHPTPPGFDGPEDRNGRRNHDEIRLLTEYISGSEWLRDDAGETGGLGADTHFVIGGDLNADPADGDRVEGTDRSAIAKLLDHPRTIDPEPRSAGGPEAAERQGGANLDQSGDPALDTADFADNRVGNLRVDYVIPSANFEILGSGVYWPAEGESGFEHVGPGYPPVSSDHRLVWVDLRFAD